MEFFEKAYVNDIDGNLLMTNTPIYLFDNEINQEIIITPREFDQQRDIYTNNTRYSFPNNSPDKAFLHFTDFNNDKSHRGPNGLIDDFMYCVENKAFAPSFTKFGNETLFEGRLFAALTGRSNSPDNLCRGFKMINDSIFTEQQKEKQIDTIKNNYGLQHLSDQQAIDTYFEDIAYYIPVGNKERCKNRGVDRTMDTPQKKVEGMDRYLQQISKFIEKVKKQSLHELLGGYDKKISVGFSDDMPENIVSMIHAFMKWGDENKFPWYQFRAYFTGDMSQIERINILLDKKKLQIETQNDTIVKYII